MMKRIVIFFLLIGLTVLPGVAEAVDFESTLTKFETYAQKGMRDWHVPGMAICVVKDKDIVYTKGFGTRRYGADRPVTGDTIFQVGSTTKAFTVAILATLVDEGVVGWDDPVVDHYPGFMMYDPWVTREFRIHDLFAQHSGMPPHAADAQIFIGYGREDVLKSMRYIQPVYSFRDKFSYVNNLFVAGAKVAEIKTGKTWETLMQERILGPLKMTHSSMDEAGLTSTKNGSDLHIMVDGKPTPLKPDSMLLDWPYIYGPAGGLNSTAPDMARWLMAHMGKGSLGTTQIFSEQSAEYMHSPRTPAPRDGLNSAYCQGWVRTPLKNTDVIWHNGGTSGICAFVGFSSELGMGVVVLTNLSYHKLADGLGFQFFEMMSGHDSDWNDVFLKRNKAAEAAQAKTQAAIKLPDLPGLPLKDYTGTYFNPIYGQMTVDKAKDSLNIHFGAEQRLSAKALRGPMHTFELELPSIDLADPRHHLDFIVDAEGRVEGVILREFNHDGTGTFLKQKDYQ